MRKKLNEFLGGTKTNVAGVYIWTNLIKGDQYVGSSTYIYTLKKTLKSIIFNSLYKIY